MTLDWIKMRADLHTHPKTVRIACALKADMLRTVGGLHRLWSIADAHTEDGRLDGYTLEIVDAMVGWPGFGNAVEAVGWLQVVDGGVVVPEFGTHNGQSAKRRAQNAVRMSRARNAHKSAHECDTREEKRREEPKDLPAATASGLVDKQPKPARKPSGPVQETLSWFRDEYAAVLGSPYPIKAKDAVAITEALKTFAVGDLKNRLGCGLRTLDPFVANSDRSVVFLVGQINRPSLRGLQAVTAPRANEPVNNGTGRGGHIQANGYNPHG